MVCVCATQLLVGILDCDKCCPQNLFVCMHMYLLSLKLVLSFNWFPTKLKAVVSINCYDSC